MRFAVAHLHRFAGGLRLAFKMGGDDAAHIEHRREQVVQDRVLVVGFVFGVGVDDHAPDRARGHGVAQALQNFAAFHRSMTFFLWRLARPGGPFFALYRFMVGKATGQSIEKNG